MLPMCSDRCHNLSGETMGTARWHAQFWLPEDTDPSPYQSAFQEAVDTVDAQMSLWKPQSDLCRLNAAPVGEWVTVPAALFAVLDQALTIGRLSGGAFDIAVGRAVEAWGFGPKPADADHLTQMIGDTSHIAAHDAVELDAEGLCVRKNHPVQLDLNGIAKGYGTDCLIDAARNLGVTSICAGIDGDLRAIGTKPDGGFWPIAVEAPDYDRRAIHSVVEVTDVAVATSGDYRHWITVGDKRLSHTINPRQGVPLTDGPASVTVLDETCMAADAWATALMVMGKEAGTLFARANGIKAMYLERA